MAKEKLEIVSLDGNKLQYKGKEFVIPQSWEELTLPYLLGYAKALFKGIKPSEILQYILIYATSIELPAKLTKKDKAEFLDVIGKASELLSFLLGEENNLRFGIIGKILGLVSPEKYLANLTAIEFVEANNYLNLFAKNNKIEDLNKLCAVLMRATCKNIRVDYSESQFNYSLKSVKNLPICYKLAIMKMYEGELMGLSKRYPRAFEGGSSENRFPYSFITSMAGDKFGTTKQVEKENIHVLLDYINSEVKNLEKNNK